LLGIKCFDELTLALAQQGSGIVIAAELAAALENGGVFGYLACRVSGHPESLK
jgi:hypothetical protein